MQRKFSALLAIALLSATSMAMASPKVIKKVPPEFPSEAQRQSVTSGTVLAKLTIDKNGNVEAVEIVEAMPKRIFDKTVKAALSEWKFEPAAEKQEFQTKLVFRAED